MYRKKLALMFVFSIVTIIVVAQDKKEWNNKKCSVVLTYDDALNVHLDNVIPLLDSLNLKGTFYLSGYFPGFKNRIHDWRKAAANGHEMANHTMFHPCIGKMAGREFVRPDYDLNNYTLQRIEDEIKMNNILLTTLDGKTKRTFAYPCGDMTAGGVSYVDEIKDDFVAARGVQGIIMQKKNIDFYNMGSYMINGTSGDEMIALVKETMKQNGLIVFLFHGVGGEHGLNVALKDHSQLLHYLKQNEKDIWVAPLINVVEYLNVSK